MMKFEHFHWNLNFVFFEKHSNPPKDSNFFKIFERLQILICDRFFVRVSSNTMFVKVEFWIDKFWAFSLKSEFYIFEKHSDPPKHSSYFNKIEMLQILIFDRLLGRVTSIIIFEKKISFFEMCRFSKKLKKFKSIGKILCFSRNEIFRNPWKSSKTRFSVHRHFREFEKNTIIFRDL